MQWINTLFHGHSAATSILLMTLVGAVGLAIGNIRIFGVSLGIGGVLFSGLAFGHYGLSASEEMMEYARELGLILFVYTIGIQVGPGFLSSLRRQGLPLNIMAASIVILGTAIVVLLNRFGNINAPAAAGLFSGATTNTPALAAAQQALRDLHGETSLLARVPALSYAVSYPFGIIGTIMAMLIIRGLFRINPADEAAHFLEQATKSVPRPETMNIEVKNPNLAGMPIVEIPTLEESGVVISRIMHDGNVQLAQPETKLNIGNVLLAVGPHDALENLRVIVGARSDVDLRELPSEIETRRVIVTKRGALGKTVSELRSVARYGVRITRVARAEIEFTPKTDFKVQFGDNLLAVGEEEGIDKLAQEIGDSTKELSHPYLIPVLIGIALGIIVGNIPIQVSGMPAPVKLGLAGGPLLVAIFLSRMGHIGPLVWYLPPSANLVLREFGITLFLACVGMRGGGGFVKTLTEGDGLYWMASGALVTFLPLITVALVARFFYKLNYASLCGMLAGSMTDPPALAFAGTTTSSDAPYISYATVYPLTVILRVITVQALVLFVLK